MKKVKRVATVLGIILIVVAILVTLYYFSPDEIVDYIGVENSYLVGFLISFFAGFSAWTSFSMVAVLVTFVLGGANPIVLGVVAGIGLAIGDLIMFVLSRKVRSSFSLKWDRRMKVFEKIFSGKFRKFMPIIIFLYVGFLPLPNDFLVIFLGMIEYPMKKATWPIVLGDMVYPLAICLLAAAGVVLF